MKKINRIFLYILLILVLIFLITIQFEDLSYLVYQYLLENEQNIKDNVSWFVTLISILFFIKSRFDSKLLKKMEREYGKQKIIESLRIIVELLDVFTPDEILKKLHLIDNVEVEMRRSMKQLIKILNGEEERINIELSKSEKKKLTKQLENLLLLIDKQLEAKSVNKELNQLSSSTEFNSNMAYSVKNSKRNKKTMDKMKKTGKKDILDNFGN